MGATQSGLGQRAPVGPRGPRSCGANAAAVRCPLRGTPSGPGGIEEVIRGCGDAWFAGARLTRVVAIVKIARDNSPMTSSCAGTATPVILRVMPSRIAQGPLSNKGTPPNVTAALFQAANSVIPVLSDGQSSTARSILQGAVALSRSGALVRAVSVFCGADRLAIVGDLGRRTMKVHERQRGAMRVTVLRGQPS
jgi:hypothetical protein